jgi:hypothetical protein
MCDIYLEITLVLKHLNLHQAKLDRNRCYDREMFRKQTKIRPPVCT